MRMLSEKISWLGCAILLAFGQGSVEMQAQSQKTIEVDPAPVLRYIDQSAGMTADEAVTYAWRHNGDLLASRKEIEAAQALIKQAGFRAIPSSTLKARGR